MALETMDENTADLIESLSKLHLEFPSSPASFIKQFNRHKLKLGITKEGLTKLRKGLLKEGVSLESFCEQAHVKFNTEVKVSQTFLCYARNFDQSGLSWNAQTEDEIHTFVELAVSTMFVKFFGHRFVVTRNNKIETSAGRADYSLSTKCKQVLRGEDKLVELSKSQDPARELLDKSPNKQEWGRFYGKVQYIFGYYCIGHPNSINLQFVCISPDKKLVKLTKEPFNLRSFSGMLGCRLFCVSLYPFLLSLADLINVDVGWDWRLKRNCDHYDWQTCQLSIGLDQEGNSCLLKEWGFKTRHACNKHAAFCRDTLQKLPDNPYLMKCVEVKVQDLQVRAKFSPFGIPNADVMSLKEEKDAKKALLQVSNAVKALHDSGFVHRDIRWPNVIARHSGGYVLVDYDLLVAVDDKGLAPGVSFLEEKCHPVEVKKTHTVAVDFWGLGHLMTTCKVSSGDALKIFGENIKKTAFTSFSWNTLFEFLSKS